jgi:flagellar biosynthesis protein FliR
VNSLSLADALRPEHWPTFVLVSARVVGLMMVAPLWSLAAIPAQIRAAMAVVITLALLPIAPDSTLTLDLPTMIIPVASELMLGVAVGVSAAFFIHGITVAAEVISLQMGLSLGAAFSGTADMGSPGIMQLQSHFALAIYAALGGHLALIGALGRSLLVIHPGAPISLLAGGRALVSGSSEIFTVAVQVAAPIMAALLVTNLALAILNRAVPQLNTMMVAVPITVAIGLVAIGATLPIAVNVVSRWANNSGAQADAVVRSFALPQPARP